MTRERENKESGGGTEKHYMGVRICIPGFEGSQAVPAACPSGIGRGDRNFLFFYFYCFVYDAGRGNCRRI